MHKISKIMSLFVIATILTLMFNGCSYISNYNKINKEKIGNEYTVSELGNNDSHGTVEGYTINGDYQSMNVKFDFMNSTQDYTFNIKPESTIDVTNNIEEGKVWVKITQGDLSQSDIQSKFIYNNQTASVKLDQWEPGDIIIWLVVEDGVNGEISVKYNQ